MMSASPDTLPVGGAGKQTNFMDQTKKKEESAVALIKSEINKQLADAETVKSLIDVTFKGFEPALMKRALFEGMMRGFEFKDFLEKRVYAIKYGDTYSLVASIDHFRKIGGRSGVVGVDAPVFEIVDGKVVSCRVTVKKRFADGYVGDFTAEVDFKEYTTGKNLWASKPKTMIAKVAEMHALRKACPEELAQVYVEEELQKGNGTVVEAPVIDLDFYKAALKTCTTLEALDRVWADMPAEAKVALKKDVEDVKAMITSEAVID